MRRRTRFRIRPFGLTAGRDRLPRRAAFRIWMSAGTGECSPRIRRAQAYADLRIGEVKTIDEMAQVAGLSRYHFVRVFREEVGKTPWAYVREARVRRAKELLDEGCSPAEAAHEAGFADQSHLTRTLRELEGRTPGAYRRNRNEGREHQRSDDRKIIQEPAAAESDHGA